MSEHALIKRFSPSWQDGQFILGLLIVILLTCLLDWLAIALLKITLHLSTVQVLTSTPLTLPLLITGTLCIAGALIAGWTFYWLRNNPLEENHPVTQRRISKINNLINVQQINVQQINAQLADTFRPLWQYLERENISAAEFEHLLPTIAQAFDVEKKGLKTCLTLVKHFLMLQMTDSTTFARFMAAMRSIKQSEAKQAVFSSQSYDYRLFFLLIMNPILFFFARGRYSTDEKRALFLTLVGKDMILEMLACIPPYYSHAQKDNRTSSKIVAYWYRQTNITDNTIRDPGRIIDKYTAYAEKDKCLYELMFQHKILYSTMVCITPLKHHMFRLLNSRSRQRSISTIWKALFLGETGMKLDLPMINTALAHYPLFFKKMAYHLRNLNNSLLRQKHAQCHPARVALFLDACFLIQPGSAPSQRSGEYHFCEFVVAHRDIDDDIYDLSTILVELHEKYMTENQMDKASFLRLGAAGHLIPYNSHKWPFVYISFLHLPHALRYCMQHGDLNAFLSHIDILSCCYEPYQNEIKQMQAGMIKKIKGALDTLQKHILSVPPTKTEFHNTVNEYLSRIRQHFVPWLSTQSSLARSTLWSSGESKAQKHPISINDKAEVDDEQEDTQESINQP